MKKLKYILASAVILNLSFINPASADKDPNRVPPLNRMSDFFATVGKDKEEKKEILTARQKNRREARQFKERQKQQKKTQKKMRKQQNNILNKIDTRKSPHGRGGIDAVAK